MPGSKFADAVPAATATGVSLVRDFDRHLVARRMQRQRAVVAERATGRLVGLVTPNFRTALENMIPYQCASGRADF